MTRHSWRLRTLVAALGAALAVVWPGASVSAQSLAQLQFDIIGVRLVVDPPALTVPKNIATQINTSLVTPPGVGAEVRDAIATLTDGAQVEGELRGPSLPPTRIAVQPGQPLPIPPLALPGDYFLDGIRLVRNGQTILDATSADGKPATTIPIRVINEVFVTSVTSKPLSIDDIRSKGIVIDERNFTAVNFQVAFNIDGTPFTISAPAVLPTPELLKTAPNRTVLVQQITALNRSLAALDTKLPPQFDRPGLNFSIAALPFVPVIPDDGDKGFDTPPVTGLIVIPGNVAFLNQFFSAMLLIANVAPDGSRLDLRDVTGSIALPKGLDRVAGTYDVPGDDPLRLARIEGVGIQPVVPIAQRGADGKLGTADDVFIIPPQRQGEGEFLIEGLREGSHTFDIAIHATLVGLPSGPVQLEGQAAGAVFVRNPTFAVTLAHPRTVRSGEPYSLYATVTNTSKTTANLVNINLDPRSISGAQLLSDATVTFGSIAPGQSAVAKYSLRAQLTGDVTFSSFTGDAALGGGIRLETGVDERGVPLSANAIVLPKAVDALPASLVAAAERVLGQAFSVATAPAEALPTGVLFVKRQTVIDRGLALAQAGERVGFGEPLSRVVQDLMLDWLGNDAFDEGFDQVLRETDAGSALAAELAALVSPDAVGSRAIEYQRRFAQATVSRAAHLSAIAAGPGNVAAPRLFVTQASGGSIGPSAEGEPSSSLQSGLLFPLADGGEAANLVVVARPPADRYTVEIVASASGTYDLGVVAPTGVAGLLRQYQFTGVTLDAGGAARVEIDLTNLSAATLSIDRDGNGSADGSRAADSLDVVAGSPRLLAVRQIESSSNEGSGSLTDPATYGVLIGALFDTPLTQASAEDKSHYRVDANAVIGARLQPGRRLVYLYLQKPIGSLVARALSVDSVVDDRGNLVAPVTQPIITVFSDGAHVFGQVRDAGGAGVGGGVLKLTAIFGTKSFDMAAIRTDANGGFDFDFVPRVGDHFVLTAQHPVTRDLATMTAQVRGAGEQLMLNPTFLGRGQVRGRIIGADGVTPVANVPIALIPGSVLGSRGFQSATNALGEFAFADVPVGVFTLSAADGRGAFGQASGLIARAGDVVSQDLRLVTQPDDGGSLVGRVFLGDGATPGSAFAVYVGQYNRNQGTIAAVDQAQTDSTGSFAFSHTLPAGGYDVVAVDPATQQVGVSRVSVIARTTSSVSIVLESVGAVEGVVFNGRGERVAGAVVAGGLALVSTDANGFFRITGVPAGRREIEAGDPVSKRRGAATVNVVPGQTVSASITLESRATITGRVLDVNGNPVPGASVRIPAIDGYTFVIANNQGVFTFPDLPLGDYLFQAPGPSKESLIEFMEVNGIDPELAFTSGDGPGTSSPPSASDKNAVLAAYQKAVQTFFSVDESILGGLPIAGLGGFGWNKVSLFQDATTVVADVKFLAQGTVAGRTVDASNRPTGAAVRISSLKVGQTGFPEFKELARFNTDPATGAFSFGGVARFDLATFQGAGVRAGDFTLEAANPFSPAHPQFRGQLSTATPNLSDIVLQFPAAVDTNGTVSGRVFMPDGQTPVPAGTQVQISFGNLTVTTDADGVFRSLLPIPAGPYTLSAQTLSGLKGQAVALVPPGGNVDVRMQVLGLGGVVITVVRPNGAPVTNASVSVMRASFPGDRASGTTDVNGVVRFVNLTEGPFGVTASEGATGLSGRASGAIVRDKELALPVTIIASGTVTGTFVSASDGQPIPFAQIVLGTGGVQAYASTDVRGRFALSAIPVGVFTVEGFDPLTNRRGRANGALQVEGQSIDVTIVQAPRGTVRGVVLNADGVAPVPAARVSFSSASFIETSLQAAALADGSFRFDSVPAGQFKIKASDPVSGFDGTASGTLTFESEIVDQNVTLEPFGSVHVVVLDVDGQPAINASVSLDGRVAAVDTHGEFTFEHLKLGTYHVVARSLADGNNGGEATAKIQSANQTADATVRFRGVGTVSVTVVPANGVGVVAGAAVSVDAKAASGEGLPGPLATTLNGFTDASGVVTFQHVPVGDFVVKAQSAALAGIASGAVTAPAATTAVQVQLGASGSVVGRLLLPDGVTAAANAFVTLRFTSQSSLQSGVLQVTTGLTGDFEFRGIPLGNFTLSAIEVVSAGVRTKSGGLASDGQRVDLGTLTLDNTAPRVLQVSPSDGSTGVGARGPFVVTFSEPIALASVRNSGATANVVLLEGSTVVPLANPELSSDGRSLTLRPNRDLVSGAHAALTLKGAPDGVQDESGFGVPDPFVAAFTIRDSIPPTVVSISPAVSATQVSLDAAIRVTYSEPVVGTTIAVRDSSNGVVAGSVALTAGGTAAVFAPTDFLRANTTYTVSVANTTDLGGNPLVGGTFGSSFATIDTLAPVIAALQLSGAARAGAIVNVRPSIAATDVQRVEYSIGSALARIVTQQPFDAALTVPASALSTVFTAVAFDVAGNRSEPFVLPVTIQPNAPPIVTLTKLTGGATVGQGQTVDFRVHATDDDQLAQVIFSAVGAASASVVQPVAAGLADFTKDFSLTVPSNAPSNGAITVQAAATDSAGGQSVPAAIVLSVRDAVNPTVTVQSPVNNATVAAGQNVDVTVDVSDDVGIANVALICVPAATGCDSRPFTPAVTTTRQTFTVTVPASLQAPQSLSISIVATDTSGNTGVAGRVLRLADTVKPTISSLVSGSGSTHVTPGTTATLRATAADNIGVTELTFTTDGGLTISGAAAVAPPIASGTASLAIPIPSSVPNGATIGVHVHARDAAGNVSDEATLALTIGDTTPPVLTVIEPLDNATVAPGGTLTVRATATDDVAVARFTLTTSGAVAVNDLRDITPPATPAAATFTVAIPAGAPAGQLLVTVEAFDTDGRSSGAVTRTVVVSDTVAPTVQITSPLQDAAVDPRTPLPVVVSATDAVGVTSLTFSATGTVAASETRTGAAATARTESFTVNISPAPARGGSLVLNANARDAAGNQGIAGTVTIRVLDVVAPDVTAFEPANNATGVDPLAAVVVRFSEPMDRATLNASSIQLRRGATTVPTVLAIGGNDDIVTLTPVTEPLAANTAFTVAVSTQATDQSGNALAAARSATFTTASPDTTAPRVASIDPADNAVGASLAAAVTVTFTEAIDPATITPQSFRVRIGASALGGSFSFLNRNATVRFTPSDPLPTNAVVITELTSAVTDAFGNALAAADGSALTTPLAFSFTTGSFSITSPAGSEVVENTTLLLEARASAALGATSVVFTVNGQAQPAVSGPPFTRSFTVDAATATPTLTIVASARNAAGTEIATDQRSVNVVVGLSVTPGLLGIPLNGIGQLRFSLSSALTSDLPISLSAGNAAVVTFPANPVVLPAGQTSVDAVIGGIGTGATAVNASSSHGLASAIVAVSTPTIGQTLTPFTTPIGLSLSNPAAAGFVAAAAGSAQTVHVTLNAPAGPSAAISVFTTNAAVATASAGALSGDGLSLDVNITTLADGIATIVVRVGNEAHALTVFVGTPPAGAVPLLVATPVGLSISNPPTAGQVVATAGRVFTISIPVLSSPADADTPVVVTTSNGSVVTAVNTVVLKGQTAATVTVTTVADGVATLTLRAGAEVRSITVFVGTPPAGSAPILLAQPVGVSVAALPTLGRLFAPLGAVRTLGVRLFDTPVAVDTVITVTTSDANVAAVTGPVVVSAGQQIANLNIATGSAGTVTLTLEAAGSRRELTLVVGSDPTPGTTPPIIAAPVGVTVMPNSSLGRVFGRPGVGTATTLGVPLLDAPAAAATSVTVTSSNPAVAAINGGASTTLTVGAGELVLQLPIGLSGTQGAALVVFEFNGTRRELIIVVGDPPASEIPALTAPVVGIRIGQ